MKKIIITVLTVIMMIYILPVSASAEETLKSPIVQYKLINHDEIVLRWTEIEGADGYYVYKTDVEMGKTVKCNKLVKDTTYNVTGLKASTDYIFKVASVSENNGHIYIGEKSSGTKLVTPDEWYYFIDSKHVSEEDEYVGKYYTVERQHYDETGREKFDVSAIYDYDMFRRFYDLVDFRSVFQDHGYVYFEILFWDDEHDPSLCLFRMKNDGSEIEYIEYFYSYSDKVVTDSKSGQIYLYGLINHTPHTLNTSDGDLSYSDWNEIFDNYKTNSDVYMGDYESDDLYGAVNLYYPNVHISSICKEYGCVFSGPAEDGEYVYFLCEPQYNISDRTASAVYRAKIGEKGYRSAKQIIWIPKDMSFIYGDPNNGSMYLSDCDGEYLYYFVYGRKADEEDRENYCTFYRISISEKNAVPMKLAAVESDKYYIVKTEINNGYMYIDVSEDLLGKRYRYYRIKTDGTELEEQDEPFEWRY